MLPIAWTYSATKFSLGPRKGFVRALIVLPICASTVVLLIQNSLALAFGLAALVAAVRFRVALSEAIDGIYIFAAICVGLAAGIGYLGVATIMALFFCLTNAIMWHMNFGKNPIDETKRQTKRDKFDGQTRLAALQAGLRPNAGPIERPLVLFRVVDDFEKCIDEFFSCFLRVF